MPCCIEIYLGEAGTRDESSIRRSLRESAPTMPTGQTQPSIPIVKPGASWRDASRRPNLVCTRRRSAPPIWRWRNTTSGPAGTTTRALPTWWERERALARARALANSTPHRTAQRTNTTRTPSMLARHCTLRWIIVRPASKRQRSDCSLSNPLSMPGTTSSQRNTRNAWNRRSSETTKTQTRTPSCRGLASRSKSRGASNG
mmetsp:Transcript_8931/g.26579  ORF Transcript_8931/g.26579 Transcript_8931/m.26579 type:complete len:201 (+) Transcript_8931:474-1076(+)